MNKPDIVARIADRHPSLSRNEAGRMVDAVVATITNSLIAGDRVELRGFGVFTVRALDPTIRRNPRTGASVLTKGKRLPRFKPSRLLQLKIALGKSKTIAS